MVQAQLLDCGTSKVAYLVKATIHYYKNTAYSIELNASVYIKEWKKEIRIMLEEDAFFDGENVRYIDGRQTELMTIPRTLYPND